MLQEMKGIGYRRGQLHLVNRDVLEQMVCECYNLISYPPGAVQPSRYK